MWLSDADRSCVALRTLAAAQGETRVLCHPIEADDPPRPPRPTPGPEPRGARGHRPRAPRVTGALLTQSAHHAPHDPDPPTAGPPRPASGPGRARAPHHHASRAHHHAPQRWGRPAADPTAPSPPRLEGAHGPRARRPDQADSNLRTPAGAGSTGEGRQAPSTLARLPGVRRARRNSTSSPACSCCLPARSNPFGARGALRRSSVAAVALASVVGGVAKALVADHRRSVDRRRPQRAAVSGGTRGDPSAGGAGGSIIGTRPLPRPRAAVWLRLACPTEIPHQPTGPPRPPQAQARPRGGREGRRGRCPTHPRPFLPEMPGRSPRSSTGSQALPSPSSY